MPSSRTPTLLGSSAIFFAIAAALFFKPSLSLALFPLTTLIFFWTDYNRDDETHVIFLFIVIVAGALLVYTSGEAAVKGAVVIELAGVVLATWGLSLHRNTLGDEHRSVLGQIQQLDSEVTDLEREQELYSSYGNAAVSQIQLRKDLTEAAKSLGTTLDQQEVQGRLVKILAKRYPQAHIRIDSGQASDLLIAWAITNRNSAVVRDIQNDERFRDAAGYHFRSAIVTPLMVMKRPFAFLRLESPQPGAFRAEDARTVDLFATLAGLTLENIQFFENVNDLATHDALTQLFTRRAFDTKLQEELLRGGRSQMSVALIMCDVDHFKNHNDTLGHQAGDMLLRTVASILTQYARPVDMVARYGGEEFCLIMPGYTCAQAAECAELIRIKIAEYPFMFLNRKTKVTVSFGVAAFPQDAAAASQLVRAADERLYQAKQTGRDRVVSEGARG